MNKAPEGTPTAVNAYILYCNANRSKLSPDIEPRKVLVELGRMWRALSVDDKQPYEDQAQASKRERVAYIQHAKLVSHTHT